MGTWGSICIGGVTPTVPVVVNSAALRVDGNKLVDGNGTPVMLRGANISGQETSPQQNTFDVNTVEYWGWDIFAANPNNQQSTVDAMKAWGLNAVRVPLNESAWLGLNTARTAPAPMPVISHGVPAYASDGDPTGATDTDYSTTWRASSYPCTLAYDLSGIPVAQRGKVYSAWAENGTYYYDSNLTGRSATDTYNQPGNYTIEANAAPGGGTAPTTGWVTLVAETNNSLHSAAHLIDLTGYNWVRFNAASGNPHNATYNQGLSINWDIHDASAGAQDAWMFYGDSITDNIMSPSPGSGVDSFAKTINASDPSRFPAQQNGGYGGFTSSDAVNYVLGVNGWLSRFPGRYVTLNYGTNDANGGSLDASTYYGNMEKLVKAVLLAGKVPIVPTIPSSPAFYSNGVTTDGAQGVLNAIQELYTNYPQVIPGPDLWTLFLGHQTIDTSNTDPNAWFNDSLHPNQTGSVQYRNAWTNFALNTVYQYDGSPSLPSLFGNPTTTDTAYRSAISDMVKLYRDNGMYVILDLHWNRPDDPTRGIKNGPARSLQPMADADHSIDFWQSVAMTFKDDLGVVFDLYNEPFMNNSPASDTDWTGWRDGTTLGYYKGDSSAGLINELGLTNGTLATTTTAYTASAAIPASLDITASPRDIPGGSQLVIDGEQIIVAASGATKGATSVPLLSGQGNWVADHASGASIMIGKEEDWPGTSGAVPSWRTAGMNQLITAVRGTGAENIVMCGGLEYSYNLTKWLQYQPADPLNQLVCSWHSYPRADGSSSTPDSWAGFGSGGETALETILANVPVIAGEVGDHCATSATTLAATISAGNTVTSIACAALPGDIPQISPESGFTNVVRVSFGGSNYEDFTLAADAHAGDTSITVVSQTAAQTHTSGEALQVVPPHLSRILPWFETNGVSYLGWTWNTWNATDAVLLKDYSGTPTDEFGAYFRDFVLNHQGSSANYPYPVDQTPVARLTVTPLSGSTPLAVTADASASSDTDISPIVSYTFDFGDGTVVGPQSQPAASHTYNAAGNFPVTLTIVDSASLTSTASVTATSSAGAPGESVPSYVQGNSSTGTPRVSFAQPVAQGSLLVAAITTNGNNGGVNPTTGVSDSVNGDWTKAADIANEGSWVNLYYFVNSDAGTPTVTVSGWDCALTIAEYKGINIVSALDQVATGTDNWFSAGPTSTIASGNDLVIGVGSTGSASSFVPGSGFFMRETAIASTQYAVALQDKIAGSTAGQASSMDSPGASSWNSAIVATFKPYTAVSGTIPDAPTNITATTGSLSASVSFTAPANDGGQPINKYAVTTSPGGATTFGTSSPITISNLSAGTDYTFTVKAHNVLGYSAVSTPSNTVAPVAPWVKNEGGIGARNGTADHTLTFTNTPTPGNLLVLVMGADATCSTPIGWTLYASAVNNTGLYVFTKTAQAGDTSVTTTHNGTNYPMAWELYEFGASATLVGTPGTTTAADGATWGQVTGLPGTPTFVLATHTFSADINLANTTPATWNAPWYKAGEYYLADDGSTDGAALALGFQNGVTATSAAPTGSDVTFPASGTGESITLGIKLT